MERLHTYVDNDMTADRVTSTAVGTCTVYSRQGRQPWRATAVWPRPRSTCMMPAHDRQRSTDLRYRLKYTVRQSSERPVVARSSACRRSPRGRARSPARQPHPEERHKLLVTRYAVMSLSTCMYAISPCAKPIARRRRSPSDTAWRRAAPAPPGQLAPPSRRRARPPS